VSARILIVEDEETLRESLKRVLIKEGYAVDSVGSSESAFRTIKTCSYDVIITDVILPGLSGMELLKKCKPDNEDLIVIVITAYATIESAVEAVKNGAYEYLVKPIIHEELKALIRRALQEKAAS
jgi:DNA-binding NtrC family response regulator